MRAQITLLAGLCLCGPASAQCVDVQTSTAPYAISQSKSVAQIHGMSDIPGWVPPEAGMAMGNFESKLDVAYETDDDFTAFSPCGPFSHFVVQLTFTQATINIGREIEAQSCMYNATVEHELKHYQSYKEALAASGPHLQTAIAAYLQQLPPTTENNAANDRYNAQIGINSIVEQYVKDLYAELARRNAGIDTPDESARVYGLCPQQIIEVRRRSGN